MQNCTKFQNKLREESSFSVSQITYKDETALLLNIASTNKIAKIRGSQYLYSYSRMNSND